MDDMDKFKKMFNAAKGYERVDIPYEKMSGKLKQLFIPAVLIIKYNIEYSFSKN